VKRKHDNGFPARDAIVAFIRANPGKIGTREIAREFGLKNVDRVELKPFRANSRRRHHRQARPKIPNQPRRRPSAGVTARYRRRTACRPHR
jgi:hypothetical protein